MKVKREIDSLDQELMAFPCCFKAPDWNNTRLLNYTQNSRTPAQLDNRLLLEIMFEPTVCFPFYLGNAGLLERAMKKSSNREGAKTQ